MGWRKEYTVWGRVEEERVGLLNYYAWHSIGKVNLPEHLFTYFTHHMNWREQKWLAMLKVTAISMENRHIVTVNCLLTKQYSVDNKICQIQNWVLLRSSVELMWCGVDNESHIMPSIAVQHFASIISENKLALLIEYT